MWCSRTDYHKNEIVLVSQAWMTLLSCTRAMIIRHVYTYWRRFSIWSQSYRLYSWIFRSSYNFVQLRQFLEETLCDSKHDRCWDIRCEISKCRCRDEDFRWWWWACMLIRDEIVRKKNRTCVLILNARCLRCMCLTDWCRFICTNRDSESNWCWWLRFRMIAILELRTNDRIRIRKLTR